MYYNIKLLKKVVSHLKSGGVIAYPTESCYGFGCDPRNYKAIDKILKLKVRNINKGLIVVSSKLEYLSDLIMPLTKEETAYVNNYWPGHYSFIVNVKNNLPANLTGNHNSLAVRVSQHNQVQQLCNYLKTSIVSTSANKTGFKSIKTYRDCKRIFGDSVLVLQGNTLFVKKPSTIINLKTKQIIR